MRKKIGMGFIAIAFLILLSGCNRDNVLLKLNWNISLPEPKEIEKIYNFDYREGDDFEIWKYSESDLENIKKKEFFNMITDDNIKEVKNAVSKYYESLEYDDNLKNKFNENFSIDKIVVKGNYYSFITEEEKDPDCYLLILLDVNTNAVYYFNHIR